MKNECRVACKLWVESSEFVFAFHFKRRKLQGNTSERKFMNQSIIYLLEQHNLRKTAMRARVLEIFLHHREALSHNDIESQFDQVDRITLYRTLKTFEDKGLIHKAIDGSEKAKYALCNSGCDEHEHHDHHAHFHCDDCGKTYCLDTIEAPAISAPLGFQVAETYLVVKGKCEACAN